MEHQIGPFIYDSSAPTGPVYDSPVRTNMTYDAAPNPAVEEGISFVYDSRSLPAQLCKPSSMIYNSVLCVQTYDPPLPGIKVADAAEPIADEPIIVERGEKRKEGNMEVDRQ
jgi:hypothetical protein